jgi:hypothetical protein
MEILGKLCVKCGSNDWTKQKRCRLCTNARYRASYAKNPSKFREFTKAYKSAHPEKVKQYNDKYYEKLKISENYKGSRMSYRQLPHVKLRRLESKKNLRLKVTDGYIRQLLSKILGIPSCSVMLSKEDYELYRKQLTLKRKYNELQKSI